MSASLLPAFFPAQRRHRHPAGRTAACALALAAALPHAVAKSADEAAALREEATRHEHGEGVARDPVRAALLYCQAARRGDAVAQYSLGWMYANGRGIERNDAWAAHLFKAAAGQGIAQAAHMLDRVGGAAAARLPDCLREPVVAAAPAAAPASGALPPAAATTPPARIVPPKAIAGMVHTLAPAYGVEPQLVLAIMKAESNFDPQALSPKNAQGLMQLIPETAERFQVKDPYDPKQNIRGGMAYLRWLLAYFQGDLTLVAAAYNAGEGAVERHRGVPPYPETRSYVSRVLAAVGALAHPFDAKVTAPSAVLRLIQQQKAAATAPTALAAADEAPRSPARPTTGRAVVR